MDLDEKLSNAFNMWSAARLRLGELKRQLPGSPAGGQLAPSPEAMDAARQIQAQEQLCQELFADVVAVADERDAHLERENLLVPRPSFASNPPSERRTAGNLTGHAPASRGRAWTR